LLLSLLLLRRFFLPLDPIFWRDVLDPHLLRDRSLPCLLILRSDPSVVLSLRSVFLVAFIHLLIFRVGLVVELGEKVDLGLLGVFLGGRGLGSLVALGRSRDRGRRRPFLVLGVGMVGSGELCLEPFDFLSSGGFLSGLLFLCSGELRGLEGGDFVLGGREGTRS
jgi:hypothetical protein